MKFKLNCSPHLEMHAITKQLFNNSFLSDVQFSVDGKIIYAHSLELMKRSVVFQNQLEETLSEKKLIPIIDCKYNVFLEFIRFIYTDECEINDDNGVELLKLATRYQIIKLENQVNNSLTSVVWGLRLFEHCVIGKYEIASRKCNRRMALRFGVYLNSKYFTSLHPDTVNAILLFDAVRQVVRETDVFYALVKWIVNYCRQHGISLIAGRQQFDHLIRKIRFPTMSTSEIRECAIHYPELLNESDCMMLGKQMFSGTGGLSGPWLSKPRGDYNHPFEYRKLDNRTIFVTKLSVSKDTILQALWIGKERNKNDIEIEINEINISTNKIDRLVFTQSSPRYWRKVLVVLGDSIRLKPNLEYTIGIRYLGVCTDHIHVACRNENVDLIYNDPDHTIQAIQANDNMLEMIFQPPGDN